MQNAKKYVLVDPQFAKATMKQKTLGKLDTDIDSILNSDASDYEKALNYTAALTVYRNFNFPSEAKPKVIEKLEPEVLESLPIAQKYKAKRIIKRLKQRPEVDWGSDGELIFRQTKIPKSNIVDLIDDVTKNTTLEEAPVGWQALAAALKSAETPRDLVPNKARWNFMQGKTKRKSDKLTRAQWITD